MSGPNHIVTGNFTLTRDPEMRMFQNGGKVANIGLVDDGHPKKDQASGKWESEPIFVEATAFDSKGESKWGKLASFAEEHLRKGSKVRIEGTLKLESWTAQTGEKRSKLKILLSKINFIGDRPRQQGQQGQQGQGQRNYPPAAAPPWAGADDDIPF